MKRNISIILFFVATTVAHAETQRLSAAAEVPATTGGLELSLALNGTEGTGDLAPGMAFDDVADHGLGLDLGVGYRLTPNLLVGGYATITGHGTDRDDTGAVTMAIGAKADWHFRPSARLDPWVSVGTGIKMMGIEVGDRDQALTGLELAKIQVGLDYRINPRFAIGPVIGTSATVYRTSYDDAMSDNARDIDDKSVNWTVTAGVLGRFDVFGAR